MISVPVLTKQDFFSLLFAHNNLSTHPSSSYITLQIQKGYFYPAKVTSVATVKDIMFIPRLVGSLELQ